MIVVAKPPIDRTITQLVQVLAQLLRATPATDVLDLAVARALVARDKDTHLKVLAFGSACF